MAKVLRCRNPLGNGDVDVSYMQFKGFVVFSVIIVAIPSGTGTSMSVPPLQVKPTPTFANARIVTTASYPLTARCPDTTAYSDPRRNHGFEATGRQFVTQSLLRPRRGYEEPLPRTSDHPHHVLRL